MLHSSGGDSTGGTGSLRVNSYLKIMVRVVHMIIEQSQTERELETTGSPVLD